MPQSAQTPDLQGPAWTASDLRLDPHAAPDKAQRVRRMFAAIAGSYDLNNRLHSFGRDQAWRRAAVRLCQPGPHDRVLDVACGTGDLTLAFARVPVAAIVGVDFTPEMLERARQKSLAKLAPGIRQPIFEQADAMALPYKDGSFEVVSIAFGIRNVSDPMCALREFRRVLTAGGRLVVLEFSEPRNGLIRLVNQFYCRRVMPWSATLIAHDRSGAYRYLPQSVSTFASPHRMAQMMREAGFASVEHHPMTFGVCTATVAHLS